MTGQPSHAADLRRLVQGEVSSEAPVVERLAWDFGQLVPKRPAVAVRPRSAADVAAVLGYATRRGIPVVPRAAGHSMNGQALTEGGIVLDLTVLSGVLAVDEEAPSLRAAAGTTWASATRAALDHRLVPPVLTHNLWATLGGTLSTGGIGTMSFRYGSQADQCLALEVVTAEGEVVECSPSSRRDLFDHVRCGLGQFGVVTAAEIRLRRFLPHVAGWTLLYDRLEGLLADMRVLVEEDLPCALAGSAEARPEGSGTSWTFPLQVWFEVEAAADDAADRLAGLRPDRRLGPHREPFPSFALASRLGEPPRFGVDGDPDKVHPWIDSLVPWDATERFVRETLARPLPSYTCHRALWPVRRERLAAPLLVAPEAPLLMGVSLLPVVARADLPAALATLAATSAASQRLGGKRYLSGWTDFDAAGWRRHFGRSWRAVERQKRHLDPAGILNPGAFRFR